MAESTPAWWASFYQQTYAELMFQLPPEHLQQACEFILRHLQLVPGGRVFDQCCGNGNISLVLAARGLQLTGIDQSTGYIIQARERAAAQGLNCHFELFEPLACFGGLQDDPLSPELPRCIWLARKAGLT